MINRGKWRGAGVVNPHRGMKVSWKAKSGLPRILGLAGLALLLFTVQASASPYKGRFSLNSPAQWGDLSLGREPMNFHYRRAFPY